MRVLLGSEQAPAMRLAAWTLTRAAAKPDAMTHLKLQKLVFYAYGALLAFDLDDEIGAIPFEAWKHGPVSPALYQQYAGFKRDALPRPSGVVELSARTEGVLGDVLNVYGRLTAWQLREESHAEAPWRETYREGAPHTPIPASLLRDHFRAKLRGGSIAFPEQLFGGSSFLLDRIPVPRFESFAAMSAATTRILGDI